MRLLWIILLFSAIFITTVHSALKPKDNKNIKKPPKGQPAKKPTNGSDANSTELPTYTTVDCGLFCGIGHAVTKFVVSPDVKDAEVFSEYSNSTNVDTLRKYFGEKLPKFGTFKTILMVVGAVLGIGLLINAFCCSGASEPMETSSGWSMGFIMILVPLFICIVVLVFCVLNMHGGFSDVTQSVEKDIPEHGAKSYAFLTPKYIQDSATNTDSSAKLDSSVPKKFFIESLGNFLAQQVEEDLDFSPELQYTKCVEYASDGRKNVLSLPYAKKMCLPYKNMFHNVANYVANMMQRKNNDQQKSKSNATDPSESQSIIPFSTAAKTFGAITGTVLQEWKDSHLGGMMNLFIFSVVCLIISIVLVLLACLLYSPSKESSERSTMSNICGLAMLCFAIVCLAFIIFGILGLLSLIVWLVLVYGHICGPVKANMYNILDEIADLAWPSSRRLPPYDQMSPGELYKKCLQDKTLLVSGLQKPNKSKESVPKGNKSTKNFFFFEPISGSELDSIDFFRNIGPNMDLENLLKSDSRLRAGHLMKPSALSHVMMLRLPLYLSRYNFDGPKPENNTDKPSEVTTLGNDFPCYFAAYILQSNVDMACSGCNALSTFFAALLIALFAVFALGLGLACMSKYLRRTGKAKTKTKKVKRRKRVIRKAKKKKGAPPPEPKKEEPPPPEPPAEQRQESPSIMLLREKPNILQVPVPMFVPQAPPMPPPPPIILCPPIVVPPSRNSGGGYIPPTLIQVPMREITVRVSSSRIHYH